MHRRGTSAMHAPTACACLAPAMRPQGALAHYIGESGRTARAVDRAALPMGFPFFK
jgi:hypothetical protein